MNYVVNSGQLVCYKKRPSSRASDRMTVDKAYGKCGTDYHSLTRDVARVT